MKKTLLMIALVSGVSLVDALPVTGKYSPVAPSQSSQSIGGLAPRSYSPSPTASLPSISLDFGQLDPRSIYSGPQDSRSIHSGPMSMMK
jgi:hypothetical protein